MIFGSSGGQPADTNASVTKLSLRVVLSWFSESLYVRLMYDHSFEDCLSGVGVDACGEISERGRGNMSG